MCLSVSECVCVCVCLTWILSTSTPLDEADDEEDEDDEGDGAHQSDEPALSRDVHLVLTVGWRHTHTHRKQGE